jgi:hypothetical protein
MKTRKLMAVALCAAACVTTTAFAEDDFGIESASPIVISDPVNPQPGATCKFYSVPRVSDVEPTIKNRVQREKLSIIVTRIDKGTDFACNFSDKNIHRDVMSWEGYIKCKRAGAYTFTVFGAHDHPYTLEVNGVSVLSCVKHQKNTTVNLNVGWNKIALTAQYWCRDEDVYKIMYLPQGSLAEPRPLGPKDMFHDQKPEEDW